MTPNTTPQTAVRGRLIAVIAGLGCLGFVISLMPTLGLLFAASQPCPIAMRCEGPNPGFTAALMVGVPVLAWVAGLTLALIYRTRGVGPKIMAIFVGVGALSWAVGLAVFLVRS